MQKVLKQAQALSVDSWGLQMSDFQNPNVTQQPHFKSAHMFLTG